MKWVGVADTQDIEKGKMRLVEVERRKVVVANVGGTFYAFNDRCGIRMRHFIWARFRGR